MRAAGWMAIVAAGMFMTADTLNIINAIGLVGERPPLSSLQTGLRAVLIAGAIVLLKTFRHPLERSALVMAIAAAGSSFLYGMGMRSPALSAFRLISHLVMYLLVAIAAGRLVRASTSTRSTPP